jgi:3'-phosphoadenosine 5'-phosphosulfate sulfotransferase (PAPS reductase)/FAD synthetase
MIVGWWSGGITSAVACKLALEEHGDGVVLAYIETGSHHPDTLRFKEDCERWYGREILTLQSEKYGSHFDVIEQRRFINGAAGALCTVELKRYVRERWERQNNITGHVWGFDYGQREIRRSERIQLSIPKAAHYFPLLEHKLTKARCTEMVLEQGIALPAMYLLGFQNNNCVGCPKGGAGYWNIVRANFPDVFDRMAKAEREIGRSCIRRYFLDELPLDAGYGQPPTVMSCGATGEGCATQLSIEYWSRE